MQKATRAVTLSSVLIGRSASTVEAYNYGLRVFLEANRFRNEDLAYVMLRDRGADAAVAKFLSFCKDRGYAPKSVLTWLAGVKLWLAANNIPCDWLRLKYLQPRKHAVKDVKAFTKGEVKRLILNARPGKKLLFWFYAVTGARLNEALMVKVGDLDLESIPARVMIRGSKTINAKRMVFLPAEIADELRLAIKAKTDNQPLFSREDDPNNPPHPHRIDSSFRALLRHTGLLRKDSSGKGYVYSLHSFRRFYETTLINSGVSPMAAAILLGHGIGVEASYYKPTLESLAAEWAKAEKALTLFSNTEDDWEIKERDNRIKQLEERLSQIELLLSSIHELELGPDEDLGPLQSNYKPAGISRDLGLIRYVRRA